MATGYSIRLATPADRGKILEVLSELLANEVPDMERRYVWLYEQNPHGRAITWIATDDASGEVAGCTSFFPRQLVVDGAIVTGALGGDGFVRPKFRRRGIMQSLHKRSREDMPRFGIEVMFGTPMPANFTPLAVAGSKDVTHVARFVRPLGARAFHIENAAVDRAARVLLLPRTRAYLDPATIADTRVDDVWRDARAELGITTVRDAAYFTWRYVASPSQRQNAFVILDGSEAIGACALERTGESTRIIDLVASRRRFGSALRAIGNYAAGATSIELRLTLGDARRYALWRRGYVQRDAAPKPLNIVLPPGEPKRDVYYDGARWYVTWTESDRDFT